MKLDIVIPSKGRKEKLDNCLNSIFLSAKQEINIYLYFSIEEEFDDYQKQFDGISNIHVILLDSYRVPDFWNGHIENSTSDAMCYLNDDVILFEDTIEMIVKEFEENFPDYDGIVGLNQLNLNDFKTVDGAFGVIGIKYAERFPAKQVWCPDYNRFFADFELWQFAQSIGKFVFSHRAQINHMHPITNRQLADATHADVRQWLAVDRKINQLRKNRDLLWGRDFKLLSKE